MNITSAEAKALGRRKEQPVKAPGELLAVFVSGKLVNPLNASAWGWQKRSRLAKTWKERVAMVILESDTPPTLREELLLSTKAGARIPKLVTFRAQTHNTMDGDGLQASLKPVRDALVECRVISGDADKDGHIFVYSQEINRAQRGVVIRVRLRGETP